MITYARPFGCYPFNSQRLLWNTLLLLLLLLMVVNITYFFFAIWIVASCRHNSSSIEWIFIWMDKWMNEWKSQNSRLTFRPHVLHFAHVCIMNKLLIWLTVKIWRRKKYRYSVFYSFVTVNSFNEFDFWILSIYRGIKLKKSDDIRWYFFPLSIESHQKTCDNHFDSNNFFNLKTFQ